MNIFYLDTDAKLCAKYHCDRHTVKMILEYAQLLSTAHRLLDGKQHIGLTDSGRKKKVWTLENQETDKMLYAATHVNHPSAKWVRHSAMNYMWLAELWFELISEYTHRYGKKHASERLIPYLIELPKNISKTDGFCHPWRAMPDQYKMPKTTENYAVESYRAYYLGEKQRMLKWKNREIPEWVK